MDNLDNDTKEKVMSILYKNQRKYYWKNKIAIREYSKMKRREAITKKLFQCVPCDKVFYDKTSLNGHMKIKKHNPERYIKYVCPHNNCGYTTNAKTRYNGHLNIKRHRNDHQTSIISNDISNDTSN